MAQLPIYTYEVIIDGPVQKDGSTWWKYNVIDYSSDDVISGWMVENREWFERSY